MKKRLVLLLLCGVLLCACAGAVGATETVRNEVSPPATDGYIFPEDFLGVHNVLLSYHCQNGSHPESGLITQEEYRPYVGYYDTDGALLDTFFDACLYLPYTAFNYSDYARTLDGWNYYLDDLFFPDRNLASLDREVGRTAQALSLDDYRCAVFTSVLYPWKTLSDNYTANTFGDLDGDGRDDPMTLQENRVEAAKWMMKQEYDRFREGGYENLTFGGFYWFEEQLDVMDAQEKSLVKAAADYAHELGVKFFWIPYYCASGYRQWKEYGFDLACMQPNYMFGNRDVPEVLEWTASITKELGMCVEMEMNSIDSPDDRSRYFAYLEAGRKYGFMHAVKMYYQDGVPGAFYYAWASSDPQRRMLYDSTYLYAKERYGIGFAPGDINGNGLVNGADARLFAEALSGEKTLSEQALAASDLNGNGKPDAEDLTLLLQRIQ